VDAAGDEEEMNANQNGTEGNMSSQMNEDGDQGGAGEVKNGELLTSESGVKPLTAK
jgi:hypothetical protein